MVLYSHQHAIRSARGQAGTNGMDRINYLMSAKRNGIKTVLSNDYESQILHLTDTINLEEAYPYCRAGVQ